MRPVMKRKKGRAIWSGDTLRILPPRELAPSRILERGHGTCQTTVICQMLVRFAGALYNDPRIRKPGLGFMCCDFDGVRSHAMNTLNRRAFLGRGTAAAGLIAGVGRVWGAGAKSESGGPMVATKG